MAKNKSKVLSYLALGDSYTVGEGLPLEHSFPALLAEKLKNQRFNVNVKVVAKTGWTTDELLEALKSEKLDNKYDLVSLLIGANNQYRNYPDRNFKLEFERLLKKAVSYSGSIKRVVVVSIPDYGCTPFGLQKDNKGSIGIHIDQLNAFSRSLCARENIAYCDITPCSRDLTTPGLLAKDALHYSAKMYRRWVNILHPITVEMLSKEAD
ncbi:MAG: SGNH/GDSL hydrolase family protein [Cyclobacteriaceae bacterium]